MSIFKQGTFQTFANMTPEQLATKRQLMAAMMPNYGEAEYVGEGLGQLFSGIARGSAHRKMDRTEEAGRKSAVEMFERTFGTARSAQSPDVQGPMSVLGMTPQSGPPMPPPDPNAPGAIAGDAMAALGKPAAHNHAASHPGETHASWLKYSNQGATRNDPLDPALVSSMSFLGDMGITMDVISGGQEPAGTPGGTRTGSTRHDHGKSADVDFYKDGRKLDWNNPNDLPMLQEIVRNAKSNGITGIGAGDDYMGAGRFHIGFGAPAIWGAGGKSANAPAWLAEAYNGAPGGAAPAPSGSAAPAPTSAPSIPINELYMALQNPWMSAEEKGLITSMIQEQQAASDPMRQMELRKAEIELAQLENPTQQPPEDFTARMFTLNSLQIDPQSEEGRTYLMTGELPEPPEPGFSTMTAEEVAQLGLPPGSYQRGPKGEIKQIGGGGTNVTVNNGGVGVEPLGTDGQILVPDPTQPSGYRVEVAPGSKLAMETEAVAAKGAKADSNAVAASSVITTAADRALEAANARAFGPYGQGIVSALNPYSDSREVDRQVAALKANAASENINAMRQASPTGGALGNASDADIQLLKDKSGALDPNSPNFERDLGDYTRTLLRVVHGDQAGDQIFAETWKGKMPEDAAQPAASATEPTKITNDAEYDALPSGTVYVGPDGKKRRKP